MRRKEKKMKDKYIDDDITIANMNVEGMPWYRPEKEKIKQKELNDLKITKKERRAMILGALSAYLPIILIVLSAYTIIYIILLLLS